MKEPIDPIAARLGANLRRLRSLAGMSQSDLGRALGVTFQQVQKYESGGNNVSASTLHRLRHVLGCELDDFFSEDAPRDPERERLRRVAFRLVRAVAAIESADVQERLVLLARSLGADGSTPDPSPSQTTD